MAGWHGWWGLPVPPTRHGGKPGRTENLAVVTALQPAHKAEAGVTEAHGRLFMKTD